MNEANPMNLHWYHCFDDFIKDYPNSNKLMWRLHQSILSHAFVEYSRVRLIDNIPQNPDTLLDIYFSGWSWDKITKIIAARQP